MNASRQISNDRQTHDLLAALEQVVRELERSHSELELPNLGSERRQHLYYLVLNDMERVANLLHLAESRNGAHIQEATRQLIGDTLEYVRKRATSIGVGIALNRIRTLRRTTDRSAKGYGHPLGQSFRLRDDLIDAVSMLHNFGLSLPDEHAEDLADSAARINELLQKDYEIAWLQSFEKQDEDNSYNLINVQELLAAVANDRSH